MDNYEKLGVFYLGRTYDLDTKTTKDELVLYDSKDLVTHAVCVGMTGSGKTGLCISLIEEAAIDGIPAILIDPKGDLANLLLTFPQLRGEDFLPWINLDDARIKGMQPTEYAAKQAETWKNGLASWDQSGERIQRLKDSADFAIYTPGSSAGLPVSILKSFAAPSQALLEDTDLIQDRVSGIVASLLGLVGIEVDPVQSKEHILLSTIFNNAWQQGQDLDLAAIIQQVQNPPISKIGVLDLESFYPSKERFTLVLALNNLLASPSFNNWLKGTPLDIGEILYTKTGKPRIAIFSIAHLSDPERMFFVSLLMNQVLSWMRSQSGTTSLRAIVYMDEIYGYLPPTANPPTKRVMLTLLKQARAFGVGLVLATQNPVDLDYKALSNAGTWFIGRLQTERDKMRLLDGLESAASSASGNFDRQEIERLLASLGSRVFLMNNVKYDLPVLFQSRWALSYLRGPLTRDQIKQLMDPLKAQGVGQSVSVPAQAARQGIPAGARGEGQGGSVGAIKEPAMSSLAPATVTVASNQPPALPPEIQKFYVPQRGNAPSGSQLVYEPHLLGAAKINFINLKAKVDFTKSQSYLTPITEEAIPVVWEKAQEIDVPATDLDKSTRSQGQYSNLPSAASQAKNYLIWARDFTNWLYGSQSVELLSSPSLKQVSKPGESERDFRVRLQHDAREQRDTMVEELRKKYQSKITVLENRIMAAEQAVEREKAQAKQASLSSAMSFGSTLLGAFTGRRSLSSTVSKASTAMRRAGQSSREKQDVARADETVDYYQKQLDDLNAQLKEETTILQEKIDPLNEALDTISIKPKKTDILVQLVALVWAPYWQDQRGVLTPAW